MRDIADYIDSVTRKSAMVKAFGSGSGIVAGSLTLAGGILVFINLIKSAQFLFGFNHLSGFDNFLFDSAN